MHRLTRAVQRNREAQAAKIAAPIGHDVQVSLFFCWAPKLWSAFQACAFFHILLSMLSITYTLVHVILLLRMKYAPIASKKRSVTSTSGTSKRSKGAGTTDALQQVNIPHHFVLLLVARAK
jgi:hypothetical protein